MNYLTMAVNTAKESGQIVKRNFFLSNSVESKKKHDIVSEVDILSEKAIIAKVRKNFPEHTIIAEESGIEHKVSDYSWYIDPLDGTSNFLLGIPYFSVSIALKYKKEVILGVVYNPILDELYSAQADKGAFLNGKKIHVSKQAQIEDALIASAYSADEDDIKKGLKVIEALALQSRKVVINFSPALDLCNIARGKLDVLVDNGTTPEDHAAGSLIVSEAGGLVKNYGKGTWNVDAKGIVASNGLLQKGIEGIIR